MNQACLGFWGVTAFLCLVIPSSNAAELIMFGSTDCNWCKAWEKEVGQIYAKTEEAKILPLKKVDINGPRPPSLQWINGVVFTPTFVVIEDNKEIGRIVGYSGEAFFWGFLTRLADGISDKR